MKKSLIIILILLLIPLSFAACASDGAKGEGEDSQASEDIPAEEEPGDIKDYSNGTPWLMVDLDGVVTEDTPADVKDNFALFANKEQILSRELKKDDSTVGTMFDVILAGEKDEQKMYEGDEPESHDAKLAFDLYHLMIDWDGRNKVGVEPLKKQTDAVESLDSIDELTGYLRNTSKENQRVGLWYAGSSKDREDSSRNVIKVSSERLLLMDSAEYSKPTEYGKAIKDAKMKLAKRILVKLGYTEAEAQQKTDNALAFETKLAPSIYTAEEQGSEDILERTNNHYTRDELKEAEGKLPILELLDNTGYPENEDYVVTNPEFLKKLNELYTEENLQLIKDLIIVKTVISAASDLDRECYEWSEECSNEIEGVDAEPDDKATAAGYVSGSLKWAVAQLYTETYLHEEDKERITELVNEIKEAYHGILEDADFLSDETREKAIEKLDAIEPRVLYPDSWEKYEYKGLDFKGPEDGGTLWEALRAIDAYELQEEINELSAPVDKKKWTVSPQTFNCGYEPLTNSIYILGAYARGDIYSSEMSDEEVLAKLGVSIGHEISHAFDRTGAQFDKDGNMKNWWTKEDKEEFKKRNAKLAEYFNSIHPWEGQDLKGSIMTGEACADMAGMKVALRVASEKENFDYDKFYRAFADLWFVKENLMMARAGIEDEHPLNYLRINCTLQQFDEFLDFYGIKEGDNMYLAPEDRVNIW